MVAETYLTPLPGVSSPTNQIHIDVQALFDCIGFLLKSKKYRAVESKNRNNEVPEGKYYLYHSGVDPNNVDGPFAVYGLGFDGLAGDWSMNFNFRGDWCSAQRVLMEAIVREVSRQAIRHVEFEAEDERRKVQKYRVNFNPNSTRVIEDGIVFALQLIVSREQSSSRSEPVPFQQFEFSDPASGMQHYRDDTSGQTPTATAPDQQTVQTVSPLEGSWPNSRFSYSEVSPISPTASSGPIGWPYDAGSKMYYHPSNTGQFYDPESQQYYDPSTRRWYKP